jgi:hypothetical protein
MSKIDSPLPVQCVEAFHHIIRITRTGHRTLIGSKPCTLTPSDKRPHRPKPCMFGVAEGLGRRIKARRKADGDWLAGNVGHEEGFRSIHSGVLAQAYVTIGCTQLQPKWLIFLFHSARIPRIIICNRFPQPAPHQGANLAERLRTGVAR